MRFDASGVERRQVSLWLPVDVIRLIKADRLNLTRFVLDQLEVVYGGDLAEPDAGHRTRLVESARDAFAKQRAASVIDEEDRERARETVRAMRAERDAAMARRDGIAEALHQVAGKGGPAWLARLLPENDPEGDRIDDWDGLVRRVGRLCGAEIDSAEVARSLRELITTKTT